jgi:hypothetical protein
MRVTGHHCDDLLSRAPHGYQAKEETFMTIRPQYLQARAARSARRTCPWFAVQMMFVALISAPLAAPQAHGPLPSGESRELSIEQLKQLYLSCNREALDRHLGKAEIMRCSMVYEELKRRAFDGDFDRLLAWSRSQPLQSAER